MQSSSVVTSGSPACAGAAGDWGVPRGGGTGLCAGQGLLCLPASGWEVGSALLSPERRFTEDEGKAVRRQGSWAASAPGAGEQAACGRPAVLPQHTRPRSSLRASTSAGGWLHRSPPERLVEPSFLHSPFHFLLNCQSLLPSL